ncbi:nucleolar protein 9 [Oratosquilla oratoria]|uniref:nucleolar protein 9 n=1 Tax=Oratosquilla oratoria TaxID=337810 RepID=UPI003F759361
MASEGGQNWRNKKKKKKSFLSKARRYGKQGSYGKGRSLSEEEYNYYIRIFEQMKQIKDEEEKEILLKNLFREMHREGQEKNLACNQIVSRILDDALPLAGVGEVVQFCDVLVQDMRELSVDPFASHVLQTLAVLALRHLQKGKSTNQVTEESKGNEDPEPQAVAVTKEQKTSLKTFLSKLVRFVFNNLDEFMYDTYASHIVRSVLECCSGVEVKDSIRSSNRAQLSHSIREVETQVLRVPKELKGLLTDIIGRFCQIPNFADMVCGDCSSAVLQCALMVLSTSGDSQCEELVDHIMTHGFQALGDSSDTSSKLHPLFEHSAAVRLLEVVVVCASSKQQMQIFNDYFAGHIAQLSQNRMCNFAVQKLLVGWKDKEQFEVLYTEVCECLGTTLSSGHTGVLLALTQACRRLASHQAQLGQALMKLLECWQPESHQDFLVPLMLYLIPYSAYQDHKAKGTMPSISLHGALMVQEYLNFNKPIKIVSSILAMKDAELAAVAMDPRGSHIIDAFLESTFVGEKKREKLLFKLQEHSTALACSKHGSRSLEALWKHASMKHKTSICTQLMKDETRLQDTQFGKIIYKKFQVKLFKRGDKSDWQQLQTQTEKKRKLLESLLQDQHSSEEPVQQKKKKKKTKDKEADDSFYTIDTAGNPVE